MGSNSVRGFGSGEGPPEGSRWRPTACQLPARAGPFSNTLGSHSFVGKVLRSLPVIPHLWAARNVRRRTERLATPTLASANIHSQAPHELNTFHEHACTSARYRSGPFPENRRAGCGFADARRSLAVASGRCAEVAGA